MHKKGFTLIELAIGTVLIGIWLAAIVNVLQYATRLTNTTKAQVVAINLTREWVESVFNIRDTNWKMFSSKKDQCWLNITPIPTSVNCETLPWMNNTTQYYKLKSPLYWISYYTWEIVLTPMAWQPLTVLESQWDDTAAWSWYRMCYYQVSGTWNSGYRDTCWWSGWVVDTKYGRYRRGIEIKWLFRKDWVAGWTPMVGCTDGTVWACWDSTAKELRFCSRVDYYFDMTRRVELCSAITNFEE